ncbi:putative nucleotidyltransferase substrate binding domain-containing protein [Kaarinaea lacus]
MEAINSQHLQSTDTFANIGPEVVEAIIANCTTQTVAATESLFQSGDAYRDCLFILYRGDVDLRRPNGEVLHLHDGALLGLSNYLDGHPYSSTAEAVSSCTFLVLAAPKLKQLEQQYPELFDFINHIIAERIRSRSVLAKNTISGALSAPVRNAMKSPMSTCSGEVSLREAFTLMQQRRIGSLGVLDEAENLIGILTCSGLSEALAINGAGREESVMRAACQTPFTVNVDAPLWQAEETLHVNGVKYLVVIENDQPVGVISESDILKTLVAHKSTYIDRAKRARSINELQYSYRSLHKAAREIWDTNRLASHAVRLLSDIHLAIQKRCVQLTLEGMESEQYGVAPRSYALLIMGSGGRREMQLNPDQDNGLIIADDTGALSSDEQQWFEEFAERLNQNLDRVGYILCPGKIMANNPMFRKTLSQWKTQIAHLVRHPNEKGARWSNIVFDFETLYGNDQLTHQLRSYLLEEIKRNNKLLGFMVEHDAEGSPPLGFFNRLLTTGEGEYEGTIDIKRNGIRLIADAARIYALSAGISSSNTVDRLQGLVRQGVLSKELVESSLVAYEELLNVLLEHQIAQRDAGKEPNKYINPESLAAPERSALRAAMRAIKRLQDQLQGQFGLSPY